MPSKFTATIVFKASCVNIWPLADVATFACHQLGSGKLTRTSIWRTGSLCQVLAKPSIDLVFQLLALNVLELEFIP